MLGLFNPGVRHALLRRAGYSSLCVSCALFTMLLVMLSTPERASAFCRESVESQSTGPCVERPGVALLHWTRSCLTQTFNNNFFASMRLMPEQEIRDGFAESFQTWAAVDCGTGRKPFQVTQAAGTTTGNTSRFVFDVENESLVTAHNTQQWSSLGHDPLALALTLLWHDSTTGEILDVDQEFNTGIGSYANCDNGCGSHNIDLRNTVTHEAGHILGLGHTSVAAATMYAQAPDGETSKRRLAQDDKDGYCSLQLPEHTCNGSDCSCAPPPIYASTRTVRACACQTVGLHTAPNHVLFGFCAALLVLRLATRRRLSAAGQPR